MSQGQMSDAKPPDSPAATDVEQELNQWSWRHQKRVYNLAYQYLGSPEEADDITQETFIRAYRNRGSFRGDAKVETWLTRIAMNLCLDALRKRKIRRLIPWPSSQAGTEGKEQPEEFPDPDQNVEAQAASHELRHGLSKAMDKLSPQQRTVFILKHLQDMSLREIVETTGLSEGSIKSQLFRAVRKIRQELEGMEK